MKDVLMNDLFDLFGDGCTELVSWMNIEYTYVHSIIVVAGLERTIWEYVVMACSGVQVEMMFGFLVRGPEGLRGACTEHSGAVEYSESYVFDCLSCLLVLSLSFICGLSGG
jgi:hypothetical protein